MLAVTRVLQKGFPLSNHFRRLLVANFHLSGRMNLSLKVTPVSSLMDEKNVITLCGLDKHQAVTLYTQLRGEDQTLFHSSAHYIANEAGRVVLDEQPSLGGSYTGLHPMGVLWSLELGPDEKKKIYRLFKRDVTTPYEISIKALRGHLSKEECMRTDICTENYLSECKFHKWYMNPSVQRIPVKEGRVRGTLFLPPGHGPHPGVIDMLGTAGGLHEYKASLLASHGFATLALAYFKHDDLPIAYNFLDIEYFEEALEWMCRHPKIQRGGVGVHGISKGAEIALALASIRPEVSAVAAVGTPHGLAMFGLSQQGKIGSCIPFDYTHAYMRDEDGVYCFRDCFNDFSDEYGIPVENIKGDFLLVVGEDDQSINAVAHMEKIVERCARHGKDIKVLRYPGAGHLLEPPYAPLCSKSYHGAVKMHVLWGGDIVQHAYAQEDYWNKVVKFFREKVTTTNSKL